MNDSIFLRKGDSADEEWLFNLFRQTMQHYIDSAWGWEELLQREGFTTSLPARGFQVMEVDGTRVGSYHLTEKPDHLLLDMILVEPGLQRRGYGSLLMEQVKQTGAEANKPISLSVLKTNPAVQFHLLCGFEQTEEDEYSLKMAWS